MSAEARFASKVSTAKSIAEHYRNFAGREYDDCITRDYGYEAHTIIPAQVLKRSEGRALKILDLGCGTGLVARAFFEAGAQHEVIGVDATPEMTDCAAKLPYARVITAMAQDALSGELAGESFDVVLIVGMMEFIADPPAFLHRVVSSCLADGGMLAIAVPHKQSFALEKRFGILTHPFEPMDATLRENGLSLLWSEDFNCYKLDAATQVKYRGSLWKLE